MTDTSYDPWKLSSGLRDDMVLSIYSTYFAPDAEYQGGRVLLLHLIGTDETGEAVTIKMSVGSDWGTADGGVTISHPTKKQQTINGSTIYGHFIANVQEIPELVNELKRRNLPPTDSRVWLNLIIHMTEKELKFGKNIEPQQRLMPTEYFGLIQDSAPATMAPVPPAPVATAPMGIPPIPSAPIAPDPQALLAQARAAAATQNGNQSPLYNELVTLAQASDWPTFLATVLADPRVLADDELAQQAIDQSQLYATARA